MQYNVEKILEFKDVFPDEKKPDIIKVLKQYNREKLVRVVNVLGMNYGNAWIPDAKSTFFSEASADFVMELNGRFKRFIPDALHHPRCYLTIRTILELLRYVFSIPANEYKDNGKDKNIERDLFKVILCLNEDLMEFTSGEESGDPAVLIYFLNYVLNDITTQTWETTLRTQVLYFEKLYAFLTADERCRDSICGFLAATGIPSLEKYAQTIVSLAVMYVEKKKENQKGCAHLHLEADNEFLTKSVCDYLSLDINKDIPYDSNDYSNRDNNVDYREFRSHPLIKISSDDYFIYNFPLLCERLYNSLFFDLKPFYSGNFFQFYNKAFVEHNLFQKAMLACLGKHTTFYAPSKEIIDMQSETAEDDNQPDFYIREKDSLIVFECKGDKINGMLKDKSDMGALVDELKNKFLLSTKNTDPKRKKKKKADTVGVTQLLKVMNMIEDSEYDGGDDIPDAVSYYPVLIIEDPKIVRVGLTNMINDWYQPLLKVQMAESESNPIIVMSVETLLLYADVFKKIGFSRIFDNFFAKGKISGETGVDWTLSWLADFDTFMREHYRVSPAVQNHFKNELFKLVKNESLKE